MPDTTNQNILLYRFLDAEAAVKTIEGGKLKVGRINDFNDPFEWLPGIAGIEEGQEDIAVAVIDDFRNTLNDTFGIICMSNTMSDPVLWSHYADEHQGVAFEFEYDNTKGQAIKVAYSNERPIIDANFSGDKDHLNLAIQKMLRQKSLGWAYEKEYRVYCDLSECEEAYGLFLKPIPEDFLMRVILGFKCPLQETDIRIMLDDAGFTDTEIHRASLAPSSYEVI